MRALVFVMRHVPSMDQIRLATELGFAPHFAGDLDAMNQFEVFAALDARKAEFGDYAVACVHPGIALMAQQRGYDVVLFNNVQRQAEGQPAKFETTGGLWFHVSDGKTVITEF